MNAVSKVWSYDKGTDTLYKPKSKVQCVMIRGLMTSWKQIIYYNFDTNMTKDLLFELITKVEHTRFPVTGMVKDLGPTNISYLIFIKALCSAEFIK